MKTAKRTITGIIMAAVVLAVGSACAGDLTPPGAPGSTMHTLEEIYQRLAVLEANQAAMTQRMQAAGIGTEVVSAGMVLIPAGFYSMGDHSTEGYGNEKPQHPVNVSAFYMDRHEVSKAYWDSVYEWAVARGYAFKNSGSGAGPDHPVHTIDWYDAVKWANARSEKDGLTPVYYTSAAKTKVYSRGELDLTNAHVDWSANGYRLPTEAEWEKAARGTLIGSHFAWPSASGFYADNIDGSKANYFSSGDPYDEGTTPVGYYDGNQAPAGVDMVNGYGLYDMSGNVYEWCWDRYLDTYYAISPDTDPRGPVSGSFRVARGGFWNGDADGCRVAFRGFNSPSDWGTVLGFRLVRAAQ